MLEQLFRSNEAAQSTIQGVAISIAASFCLSFLLVLTYRLTSREVVERREFMQGMALISIVATMVMQAIGDSLARGLGMLGALSIIRFRTSLTSPRNMSFMFASLAAGIACGVFGFTIALIGTVSFCLIATALSFEFRDDNTQLTGEVRITLPTEVALRGEIEQVLRTHTSRLELAERRYVQEVPAAGATTALAGKPTLSAARPASPESLTVNGGPRAQVLTYRFRLRKADGELKLLDALDALPNVVEHRLRFTRNLEQL